MRIVALMFAPMFALVAFIAAGCSATQPPAAEVNGTRISQDAVYDELAAAETLQGGGLGGGLEGLVPDSWNTAAAAAVVTQMVYMDVLVPDAAAKMGIEITDADVEAERAQIAPQQEQTLAGLPEDLAKTILRRLAYQSAISAKLAAENVDEAKLLAEYESDPMAYERICTSLILTNDLASAEQAAARINAGESFEAVFSDVVTNPQLLQQGSEFDCLPAAEYEQLQPGLSAALTGVGVGEITEAILTTAGGAILRVDRIETPTFEEVREQLLTQAGVNTQQLFTEFLVALGTDANVSVNPRFGTWVVTPDAALVRPPEAPADTGEEADSVGEEDPFTGLVPGGGQQVPVPPPAAP